MDKKLKVVEKSHHHADGKRCCGRLLSEKCSPKEEAANTDAKGNKSCCKGENHDKD